MITRFYFNYHNPYLLRGEASAPARLIVHDIDAQHCAADWVIDCEISTNGKWGILGKWRRVEQPESDYPRMLREASENLAGQYFRAGIALGEIRSICETCESLRISVAGSSSCYVDFRPISDSDGMIKSWRFRSYVDWDNKTQEFQEIEQGRYNEYNNFVRGAIVERLKKEVEMKQVVGLKETADFRALEGRLRQLADQFHKCQWTVPCKYINNDLNWMRLVPD